MQLTGSHHFEAPRELLWEMLQDPEVLARVLPGCEKLEKTAENRYSGRLKIKIGPVNGKFNGTIELSDLNPPISYTLNVKGNGPQGIINGDGNLRLADEGAGTTLNYDGEATISGRIASVGQRLMESSAKAITKQALVGLEQQVEARQATEAARANADIVGEPDTVDPQQAMPDSPPPTPSDIADVSRQPESPAQQQAPPIAPAVARQTAQPVVEAQPSAAQQVSSAVYANASARPRIDAPPPPSQLEFALGVAQEVANDLLDDRQQRIAAISLLIAGFWFINRLFSNSLSRRTADRVVERLREDGII